MTPRLPDGRFVPADPDRAAEMRRLQATGLSTRQIGLVLGISKGQVVGVLYRAKASEPQAPRWEPPEPKGCRWIDGDTRVPGWRWCGAPIMSPARGYWCAAHRKRVYAGRLRLPRIDEGISPRTRRMR